MIRTVSIELAKKMKELGFPQESHFYWKERKYHGGDMHREPPHSWQEDFKDTEYKDDIQSLSVFAAPTAEEVLEQLNGERIQMDKYNDGYYSLYWTEMTTKELHKSHIVGKYSSLVEASAELWVYLKENKLILI